MLNDKMNALIDEVCSELAEREELVHTIALALLTGKNLFVLGEPGQAKSQAIDLFRSHITGAKQFDILMSKGTDQEQLFGRLDLASIIPGHVSHTVLNGDPRYAQMRKRLAELMDSAQDDCGYVEIDELHGRMNRYKAALALQHEGVPEMVTANKIPESHICFLDEIFKANDGVLNSLLKALNERTYTNEGVSVSIPVISFFAASNEIPNFHNPEEKSLRALYDRFDFKVCTRYVEDKANRMKILQKKQKSGATSMQAGIRLEDLYAMQEEVKAVKIPGSINELADNILCELRRKDIMVTDRTYFGYSPVVQAEAWLAGRDTVQPQDMKALINYLWDKPEDREIVEEAITRLTENPLGDKLDELLARAYQCRDEFDSADSPGLALIALRSGLLAIYDEAEQLKDSLAEEDPARSTVEGMIATLEGISREAHAKTAFTYLPLPELKAFKQMSA
ncbi:MAG TPA: AAA family ATPase [Firmicutes bacterium]|nr:AAA family ATPase [Bacillota bacterium]